MLQYFLPRIPKNRGLVNRPREFLWLQQKLSAYRFLYNFCSVFPYTFLVGIFCLAVSTLLYIFAVQEVIIDYTDCISDSIKMNICYVQFTLEEDMEGDVELHYGLEGFYQNARPYLRSRDDSQLMGQNSSIGHCQKNSPNYFNKESGIPVVPCGVVAGSLFNDTFKVFYDSKEVPLTSQGINVDKLRNRKYRNPKVCDSTPCDGFEFTVKPHTWSQPVQYIGDSKTGFALQNLDLIVWMETAALPTFRKIYKKVKKSSGVFRKGLPKGNYEVHINNNYPVNAYGGRKKVILTRKLVLGGNVYHCVGFLVIGCILLQFGVVVFCWKCLCKSCCVVDRSAQIISC